MHPHKLDCDCQSCRNERGIVKAADRLMDKMIGKPLSEQLRIMGEEVRWGSTSIRRKSEKLVLIRLAERAFVLEVRAEKGD